MNTQRLVSLFITTTALLGGCVVTDDEAAQTDAQAATASSETTESETADSPSGGDPSSTASATDSPGTSGSASATISASATMSAGSDGDSSGLTDPSDGSGGSGSGCRHLCEQDSDCLFQGGSSVGLRCGDGGFCAFTCSDDLDCLGHFASNPMQSCSSNSDCIVTGICIDRGAGFGACAFITPAQIECPSDLPQVEVVDIEGNPASVCGQSDAYCGESDDGTPICELAEGCDLHGCPDGLSCGEDGVCFCVADADCGFAGNTCTEGVCSFSCSNDAECSEFQVFATFEGGSIVCE